MGYLILMILFFHCFFVNAQPFTKQYFLTFHTCDENQCNGPQDHTVQLAESEDGSNWTLVPNFPTYNGSVPDVIIRNNKMYIYTPGKVKRYDNNSNSWDSQPTQVTIFDSIGNTINYVDPSSIIDSSGRIVLIFMNSNGISGDPAQCNPYPCTKYFDSAIEKDNSDGTEFTLQSGHRYEVYLTSGTASDPDIYFDGNNYIMYISRGSNTYAYYSPNLHGNYQAFPDLNNGLLTTEGGIACGYYDPITHEYWTYVHASSGNLTEIKQGIHTDFNTSIGGFNTVVSGSLLGIGSNHKSESPGFTQNTFDTTSSIQKFYSAYPAKVIYSNETKLLDIRKLNDEINGLEIYNILGERVYRETIKKTTDFISVEQFSVGLYIVQAISKKEKIVAGKFVK